MKQFCIHGHDTTVVGRYRNGKGMCKVCFKDNQRRYKEKERRRAGVPLRKGVEWDSWKAALNLPTEDEMRRMLEDRTCVICGVYETSSWREGVCDVCKFLANATPEQRAEYERRMIELASGALPQ
jgi:hypothetical protein